MTAVRSQIANLVRQDEKYKTAGGGNGKRSMTTAAVCRQIEGRRAHKLFPADLLLVQHRLSYHAGTYICYETFHVFIVRECGSLHFCVLDSSAALQQMSAEIIVMSASVREEHVVCRSQLSHVLHAEGPRHTPVQQGLHHLAF